MLPGYTLQTPLTLYSGTRGQERRTARTGAGLRSGRSSRVCCATSPTGILRYVPLPSVFLFFSPPHSVRALFALQSEAHRASQTTLFGVKYPTPLLVAPIECQAVLHPEAECATARAAGALGIPLVLSGAASRSLEAVAAANGEGAPRWFQMYWCVLALSHAL